MAISILLFHVSYYCRLILHVICYQQQQSIHNHHPCVIKMFCLYLILNFLLLLKYVTILTIMYLLDHRCNHKYHLHMYHYNHQLSVNQLHMILQEKHKLCLYNHSSNRYNVSMLYDLVCNVNQWKEKCDCRKSDWIRCGHHWYCRQQWVPTELTSRSAIWFDAP